MIRGALLFLLVTLAVHGSWLGAAASGTAVQQCGLGLLGLCSNPADCCSEFGECGKNATHCGFGCKSGPCWKPTEVVRFYVDQAPAEALGLGGNNTVGTAPPAQPSPPAAGAAKAPASKAPALAVVDGPVYGNLQMTTTRKRRALALTNIFENSRTDPQFGYCEFIGQGQGIAFGIAGFTTGSKEAARVLEVCCRAKPNNILCGYQAALQAIAWAGGGDNTTGLEGFCAKVRRAAVDASFVEAQRTVQDELYWTPAERIASQLGVKLPLTVAAVYDAVVQHGEASTQDMADYASDQLGGGPGDGGVDEKQWLQAFLAHRRQVLFTTADKAEVWPNGARRLDIIQRLAFEAHCWALDKPIIISTRKPYIGCWVQDGFYGENIIL